MDICDWCDSECDCQNYNSETLCDKCAREQGLLDGDGDDDDGYCDEDEGYGRRGLDEEDDDE